jgi:hypothetical protein
VEVGMAECLACGGQVCAATWALRAGERRDGSAFFELPEFHAALRRYMGFARDHEALYTGSQPCTNVWVYHSLWSLSFDHKTASGSVLGFEQALLGRIAYRVAKQQHLPQLASRDVLIVASQTCLGDQECDALRAAVGRGCGLILTERTAECDENFRQRDRWPLADLAAHPRVRYFEKCLGRISQPKGSAGAAVQAAMPSRAAEILQSVRELAREGLAAELDGGDQEQPLTFIDVYRRPGGCVAHIVYYGDGEPQGLRLRVAPWLTSGKPVLYSPYLAAPAVLKPSAGGWIELPGSFARYCAVKFDS